MKRNITWLTACILSCLALAPALLSGKGQEEPKEILIASGGGYKKPVLALCESFTGEEQIDVNTIFGNMQTVSLQIRESGKVGLLIGDRKFLENPGLGVEYGEYLSIGEGKLVLAWSKGTAIGDTADLLNPDISRISLPDTKKAIYGLAASEYLSGMGLWDRLEGKILIASTVPQVSSYLISGEVDAGFINLTDAIAIEDSIGGYMVLDEGYTEIEIVAGLVEGYEKDESVRAFLAYLDTPAAGEIFESYGL